MENSSPFVDTNWLADNLSRPDVCVIDGSWHLPYQNRNGEGEFLDCHIPGAVYFDLDKIADTNSDLPHMVASPDKFSRMVGALGIRDTNTIVVYDSVGLFSAARVWWNFKIMGVKHCVVLEGGLPKWKHENRPVQTGPNNSLTNSFSAVLQENTIFNRQQIFDFISHEDQKNPPQIIDLRPNMRFAGLEEEPRDGLRSGNMPNSINLPFYDLIIDGCLVEPDEIIRRLQTAGIDLSRPVIASCGSGVTAPILCLALAEIGVDQMQIYDGSWAEWGMNNGLPVIGATGDLV